MSAVAAGFGGLPANKGIGQSGWYLLLQSLVAAVVFGTMAALGVMLTQGAHGIAAVWLPNAVALVFFVRCRFERPRTILAATTLGNIAASLLAERSVDAAVGLALCNTAEIALALVLIRRWCGLQPEMQVLQTQMRFIAASALIAPMASATLALVVLQPASVSAAAAIWFNWALTDGLGMLIVAPAGLIVSEPGRKLFSGITARVALEWLVLTLSGTAVTLGVFLQNQFPFLFLVLPVVLLHAFRMGMVGTAFAVIQVAILATLCTWMGQGPINLIAQSLATKLIVLQCFLATAFAMGLPVAAALDDQVRLLARIRENEEELALLTQNVSDAVMRIALDGTCEFASPSAAGLFGLPIEKIVGTSVNEVVADEDHLAMREAARALTSGAVERDLYTFRSRTHASIGRTVWIEVNCALVRHLDSGAPQAFIASARDVTARVELEAQLVRARRHAENAAAAKSQFLANMSHEIRTPMNGVLGFAELLLHERLPDKSHRHVGMIVESGKAMMRLLNDVLDISKIEAGQFAVTCERVAVSDLLQDCARLMSANAEQKGLNLEIDVAPGVPEAIVCDGLRLRQIILNLIGNAVKFTAEGRVRLDVRVVPAEDASALEISVSDTGIGIAETQIEAIFRPFEQGENSVTRRFGGTGLGLSISRQLAGLLGGTLVAHSRQSFGSRFVLTLPLLIASAHFTPSRILATTLAAAAPLPAPPPQGRHILLVEDHDINRILVSAMLERLGQRVTIAVDGSEAISLVLNEHRRAEPFDLVLMDVQMPICDGYAATRAIRDAGIDADVLPIVALTANAFREDVREALAAGMQGHLAKPLEFAALSAMLAKMLVVAPQSLQDAALDTTIPEWSAPAEGDPLTRRWHERRAAALGEVAAVLRSGHASGAALDELAATMHQLAGSAGMFGEGGLGEQARALEHAIRSAKPPATVTDLAETILRAA